MSTPVAIPGTAYSRQPVTAVQVVDDAELDRYTDQAHVAGGAPAPLVQGGLGYNPASLPNWSGVAPSSVWNALDRIAAKIGPIP